MVYCGGMTGRADTQTSYGARDARPSYRVLLTGWMHGDTFEDHADVDADTIEQAIQLAIGVVENRWDGTLEVGDCNVEQLR